MKTVKITDKQYNIICTHNRTTLLWPKLPFNPIQEDLIKLNDGNLNEGYYKTYPLKNVVKYIQAMLGKNGGHIETYETDSNAVIVATIQNNEQLIKEVNQAFRLCGYFQNMSKIEDNGETIKLQFEPRYSDKTNEFVRELEYLLHITPTKHIKKILANGLSPRSTNMCFDYPPRVYLLMPNISRLDVYAMIETLANGNVVRDNGIQNLNKNIEKEWTILKVEVNKIPKDVPFYGDTMKYDGTSVYTYDNIPPSTISIVEYYTIPSETW